MVSNHKTEHFQRPAGSAKFGVGKSFILRNRFAVWRTTSSYYVIDGHITASELILLDEHTAALDPATSKTVMELTEKLITEQNLTAFMVTHDMEDAIRYGSRLIMLHQGRIVVDIQQEEKQQLTVPQLLALFKQNSGTALKDDQVLLSS